MNTVQVNGKWPLQVIGNKPLLVAPGWETERFEAIYDLISPGTVVYDIGAEDGDFPALYGTWGAEVVLIEPSPFAWPQIRLHWETNVDHRPAGMFVGFATDQDVTVAAKYDDRMRNGWPRCAFNPQRPEYGFWHVSDEFERKTTRHNRLDTLKEQFNWPTPDVLTIDVEGSEGLVLRGAAGILEVDRPQVLVSVHETYMKIQYGETVEQLWEFMAGLGYTGSVIAVDHETHVWFKP